MSHAQKIEILKEALLLEKRGQAFYQKVADQTEHNSVKDFFTQMAEEEKSHIHILLQQYRSIKGEGRFSETDQTFFQDPSRTADEVLSEDVVAKISTSDYESAAIGAAINMEEKAIKVYSERAARTDDAEEQKLYVWLAEWEKAHLNQLLEIDKSITEKIWQDNNFWPF